MKKILLSLLGAAACLTASATDYELVTSAGELIPGDNYIVVGKKDANTYAMGPVNSKGNNFSAKEVTLSGTKITLDGTEGVQPLTLRATSDATYAYQFEYTNSATEKVYLYAKSTSSNYMGATATATETRSFASVEIASTGVATVKFNNTTKNLMRFNTSSVIFAIYGSDQTDVYLYKEVTAVAEVEKPVFSVASGTYAEAFGVTISCGTEGAEIRYTTDGTEPDASSTLYTAGSEITVSATTTLKAIALKGDASSAVATAVYTFPVKYTSMAALLEGVEMPANNKTSDAFVVGFDAIVTYVNGGNVYFVQNGTPGLIFKYDTGYVPGDVIKAGWIGHLKNYNGLPELEPESAMTSEGTADVPEPLAFTGMDGAALNSIVKVEGVTFAEATPGTDATGQARNFTGTWGDDESELAFYNQFKIAAVEAGKYTVLAVVGCYNTTMQLQPISYEEYVEPVDPATTVYYVLPLKDMDVADNNEESAFIPTTFFPWYQCSGAPVSVQPFGNLRKANVYTFTADANIGPEAASGGWLSSGVDLSEIVAKDYDLLFSVKTTSSATMAVKLVVDGEENKGNEVQFAADNNGEWQTVRMNVKEKFPNFANSGVTTENAYVFAFVAGAGLQGGDVFEIANVRYVPAGTTDAEPTEPAPIECPDHFYLIGNIDGGQFAADAGIEMTKEDNTFTFSGEVTGAGYFGFTSALGADANDWATLNASRWGAADGTEVTVDVPMTLEKAEGSLKMLPGNYDFTVVFGEETVTLTVTVSETPVPVVVPEHLYVIGNFAGAGWNPAAAVEMTRDENTFTAIGEVTGDCNFGFGSVLGADSSDWDTFNANRYGQAVGNAEVALDTPVALVKGDGAIRLAEAGTYKLTVVFAETGITFTASVATGIDGVAAGADAPAEYYNLQGVRVENPAQGLYIVVRNGKATKEYVK